MVKRILRGLNDSSMRIPAQGMKWCQAMSSYAASWIISSVSTNRERQISKDQMSGGFEVVTRNIRTISYHVVAFKTHSRLTAIGSLLPLTTGSNRPNSSICKGLLRVDKIIATDCYRHHDDPLWCVRAGDVLGMVSDTSIILMKVLTCALL